MVRHVTEFVYTTPGADQVEQVLNKIAGAGENVGRKVKAGTGEASAGLKALSMATNEAQDVAQGYAATLGPMGRLITGLGPAGLAAAAGIGAVVTVLAAGAEEAEKHNRANRQTEAVLRATGNQAGKTAKEIRDLASEMERKTLADDVAVKNAANVLLTFDNITGKTFDNIIRRAQDFAANGIGTLEGNVRQLGKAFQDPITGLGALSRMGVVFDPIQKEMITNLAESNRLFEAQGVLMDALAGKVGGAGEAEQAGLTGSMNRLTDAWEDFITAVTDPKGIDIAAGSIDLLARALEGLNRAIDPGVTEQLSDALGELAKREGELGKLSGQNRAHVAAEIRDLKAVIAELQRKQKVEFEAEQVAKGVAEEAANRARLEREAAVKKQKEDEIAAETFKKIAQDHDKFLDSLDAKRKRRDAEEKAATEQKIRTAAREAEAREDLIATAEIEADAAARRLVAQREGAEALQKTNNELEIEAQLRKLGADATDEQRAALERIIRARQADNEAMEKDQAAERASAEAARESARKLDQALQEREREIEAWVRDVENAMRDFWVEAFDGSLKDALPAVGETLMRWWIGLQSQMLMRPLILPFAAGMAGGGGAADIGIGGGNTSLSTGGFWGLGGVGDGMRAGAMSFAQSGIGRTLGLSAQTDITSGMYPMFTQGNLATPMGSLFADGVAASPWGMVGTLGANLVGWNGTGNALADTGLSLAGSIGGGMAGAAGLGPILGAAGGPVGAIIGAFLAQGLGTLLAGRPSDQLEAESINLRTGGRTSTDLGPNKDSPQNRTAANGVVDAVAAIASAISNTTGATFNVDRLTAEVGTRSGFRAFGANDATGRGFDQEFATGQEMFRAMVDFMLSEVSGVSDAVKNAISAIDWEGDLNAAARSLDAIVQFEGAIASLEEEINPTSSIQQALAAIRAQFSGMAETLTPLGITIEQITEAEGRAVAALKTAVESGISDSLLQLTDNIAYQIGKLDEEFAIMRADATALGINPTQLNALYNAQRGNITGVTAAGISQQLLQATNAVAAGLAELDQTFILIRSEGIRLGIPEEQINALYNARRGDITGVTSQGIGDRILELTDPEAFALAMFERTWPAIRAEAIRVGVAQVDIDRLYNEERLAITSRFGDEIVENEEEITAARAAAARDFAQEFIRDIFDANIQAKEAELEVAQKAESAWRSAAQSLGALNLRFSIGEQSGMTLEQRQSSVMQRLEEAFAGLQGGDASQAEIINTLAPEAMNLTSSFFRDSEQGVAVMDRIRAIVGTSARIAADQVSLAERQVSVLEEIRDAIVGARGNIGRETPTGMSGEQAQAVMTQYAGARAKHFAEGGTEESWAASPEFQGWVAVRDSVIANTTDTGWLNSSLAFAQANINDPVQGANYATQINMINNRLSALGMVHENGGTVPMTGYALVHRGEEIVNRSGMAQFGADLNGVASAVRGSTMMTAEGFTRMIALLERVAANTADARGANMLAGLVGRG